MSEKKYYVPTKLLTDNNAKTSKGEKYGWKTYILYLAPFTQNDSGINVCSHASAGCAIACLYNSGHGSISNVVKGRRNKTNFILNDRVIFLNKLVKEIEKIDAKSKKESLESNEFNGKVCIRLNGTSDLAFEKFKVRDGKTIMELFPHIQFYDYTKNPFRFKKELPSNYHLTFSRSEENDEIVDEILEMGGNVAVVFDKLPTQYKGYKVINGDKSDLRFLDEKNVIVGLKYKRDTNKGADNEAVFKSGFGIRFEELQDAEILEIEKEGVAA